MAIPVTRAKNGMRYSWLARIPQAAPLFSTWTRSKSPGMTSTLCGLASREPSGDKARPY